MKCDILKLLLKWHAAATQIVRSTVTIADFYAFRGNLKARKYTGKLYEIHVVIFSGRNVSLLSCINCVRKNEFS